MAATFSYAQAAKGQAVSSPSTKPSSSAASGTATPASTALTETPSATSAPDHADQPQASLTSSKTTPSEASAASDSAKSAPRSAQAILRHNDGASSNDTDSVNDSVFSRDAKSDTKPSSPDSPATTGDSTKSNAGESAQEELPKAAPKPVFQEAKPPTVNIWAQRAADFKSKQPTAPSAQYPAHASPNALTLQGRTSAQAAAPETDRSRPDSRRKSEQGPNRDGKRGDAAGRPREDLKNGRNRREPRSDDNTAALRRTPPKSRELGAPEAAPPSVSSQVAWPKPEDAQVDEKKRQDERDRAASISKPHGKTEWKHMPYTPTAVFETRIEGKAGPRVGKGTAKPGPPVNTKTSNATAENDTSRSPTQASLSNGTHAGGRPARAVGDKDAPQTAKDASSAASPKHASSDTARPLREPSRPEQSLVNGITTTADSIPSPATANPLESAARAAASPVQLDATRNFEPSQNGHMARKASTQIQADASLRSPYQNDYGSQTPRSAHTERRSEPHIFDATRDSNTFRESKRGTGKGRGRGGFGNSSFGSPSSHSNSFQEFGSPQFSGTSPASFHPGRGSGRGFRGGLRSHSIPVDTAFGRPLSGFGFNGAPLQQFMPYYGAPFSAGPIPGGPQMDREYLIASVLNQAEYYFSIDNLLKDLFLRKHMDSQGWIYLHVIAQFHRMKALTTDHDILKAACLQSQEIEIRVGDDNKVRLRTVHDWEKWVLPVEDRDSGAQNDGPKRLRQVSPVRVTIPDFQPMYSPGAAPPHTASRAMEHTFHIQDAASAPFYPGSFVTNNDNLTNGHIDEPRGRQSRESHRRNDGVISPLSQGFSEPHEDPNAEPDRFPSSQIEFLTVLVRKPDVPIVRPAPHNAGVRTFSNGSIDSRNIMEEISRAQGNSVTPLTNGHSGSDAYVTPSTDAQGSSDICIRDSTEERPAVNGEVRSDLDLFWVKDREKPIDEDALPTDTSHEQYTNLRSKALVQRGSASTGNCPYDLDVLYQFWSHFLVRNFNSRMYYEFRTLAHEDVASRHSSNGLNNLIAYYNGMLTSQVALRETPLNDFVELVKGESRKGTRPAFTKLRDAWRSGTINVKNRKKISEALDDDVKAELES